jgi:hypothetical protein
MAKQQQTKQTGPTDAPEDLKGDGDAATATAAPPLTVTGAMAFAEQVSDGPKPGMETLSQLPPGMIPPPAQVATLPKAEQMHYYAVFPDMAPKPVDGAPGVWMNNDGTPYVPRQRTGGQFSALVVEITNRWRKDLKRIVVVPMGRPEDKSSYGVKEHEIVTKRVECIFDFESDLLECLKAFGMDAAGDPLRAKMEARGFRGAYDDPGTTPGLMRPNI